MASVVRRTLRCSRAERAEIRDRAAALGMHVSGYLVACALHEDAGGPRRDEPRLALSEEQQRTLYERVEEMDRVRRALGESLSGSKLSVFGAIAFSRRYENGATIVTSNLPFQEWTTVFASERLTGALLDRITHHGHILEINGESRRLKQSRSRRRQPSE